MTRIYKPIVRRTAQGYLVRLFPGRLAMEPMAGRCTTMLRCDLVRETSERHGGEVIVVELRPRTVALRLKGHREEMEIGYIQLEHELKKRNYAQISYGVLFTVLAARAAQMESRERFLNRRSA